MFGSSPTSTPGGSWRDQGLSRSQGLSARLQNPDVEGVLGMHDLPIRQAFGHERLGHMRIDRQFLGVRFRRELEPSVGTVVADNDFEGADLGFAQSERHKKVYTTAMSDFAIGSTVWPGLSKLIEEAGEVQQVCGKLLGTGGAHAHWDGTDLRVRLEDEIADVMAACMFVQEANMLNNRRIEERILTKLATFQKWHRDQVPLP